MTVEAFRRNIADKIGEANLDKVRSARIGIAGAGGLGSNCALNLVRVGFRDLTIVDFDKVDPSNLDRQFYFLDQVGRCKVDALKENLLRIEPGADIKAVNRKIEKEKVRDIFSDCDIVAECLDSAPYKKTLIEELLLAGKFVVAVSGVGGVGASDEIKTHNVTDRLIVIGDLVSDISDRPALSPRVNVASAKQADSIMDYVLKGGK